jgi:cell division protein FtsI (penicillin-binding protein 3)
MYIKRHVSPNMAKKVMALKIPGVNKQREYRRYYPAGVIAGHVVGFTNIDDRGLEGLELAYDDWLRALPGKKRVLKDRFGNIVETVESVSLSLAGKDLVVSIDRRIQYMTYRALKQAVEKHKALSATAVVVDVQTGEVLAMANYPGFNPNNRAYLRSSLFRNRAITDVFEPGSTMKPFTIAAALESGRYTARSIINTAPGALRIGRKTIRDHDNYGWLSLARIIEKSSNVGAAKVALSMKRERLWKMFRTVGFGEKTGLQQPGESNGLLRAPEQWARLDQATISYGYGISVTAVQLARAYLVFANNGNALPLSLLPGDKTTQSIQVMSVATATTMRSMLERAVSDRGTGRAARIVDYRVAGKTGTTHKLVNGKYADHQYISVFAGMAPATRPRLVMVVKVEEPTQGGYYGGVIAAPVFKKVMTGSLRALNVIPDDLQKRRTVASKPSRHPG